MRVHEWDLAILRDIPFISSCVKQSAVNILDPSTYNRINKIHEFATDYIEQLNQKGKVTSAEHYVFLIQITLSQIRDDHSYINISGLKDNQLRYAGFLCTYSNK